MSGPQNGLVGAEDYGMTMPQTEISDDAIAEIKNMAKFSKSKEYKKLEEHLTARIAFFQTYLPDGTPVVSVKKEERDAYWLAANILIPEFKQIMAIYQDAREAAKHVG